MGQRLSSLRMMKSEGANMESSFFATGGSLQPDAPSYVERRADRELYDGLLGGEFCYVLTARRMGKSSLMVGTAQSSAGRAPAWPCWTSSRYLTVPPLQPDRRRIVTGGGCASARVWISEERPPAAPIRPAAPRRQAAGPAQAIRSRMTRP